MKLVLAPLGLLAGLLGKRAFQGLWKSIEGEEPPVPEQREAPWAKLVLALALEGAVLYLVKGLVDRGARSALAKGTGRWPGEEQSPER